MITTTIFLYTVFVLIHTLKFPELSLELGSQLLMFFVFLHSCPMNFQEVSPTKNSKRPESQGLWTFQLDDKPPRQPTPSNETGRRQRVRMGGVQPSKQETRRFGALHDRVTVWFCQVLEAFVCFFMFFLCACLCDFVLCIFIEMCTSYVHTFVYCTYTWADVYPSICVYIMCTSMCTYKNTVMTMSVYVHIYVVCSHVLFACLS